MATSSLKWSLYNSKWCSPNPPQKNREEKRKKRKYIMLRGNTGNIGSKIVKSYLQFFEMLEAFYYKTRTIVVIITRAKMPSWAHIIYIHTSHTHCSVLMKWVVRSFETVKPLKESTPKSSFSLSSHKILLLSDGSFRNKQKAMCENKNSGTKSCEFQNK